MESKMNSRNESKRELENEWKGIDKETKRSKCRKWIELNTIESTSVKKTKTKTKNQSETN